jgi:hypothetical protein
MTKMPCGKVAEPHRPREVALSAHTELGKESPREHEVDVVDADAEGERGDATKDCPDVGVEHEARGARVSDGPQRRPLRHDLEQPPDERPHRQRKNRIMARRGEDSREPERRHEQRDVEQPRGKGRDSETAVCIEGRHSQGGRAHEEDVRKDGARQCDGALEFPWARTVARGEELRERTGERNAQRSHDGQGDQRDPADAREEALRRHVPVLRKLLRQHRHDSARDGPFAEQLAQGVRDGEGDPPGVRCGAFEHRRKGHVPQEPQHARRERARPHHPRARNEPSPLAPALGARLPLSASGEGARGVRFTH